LAWAGEGDYAEPGPHERTVADYVSPHRAGSATTICNAAAREVAGEDVTAWPWPRLVQFVAGLRREAQQRREQAGG